MYLKTSNLWTLVRTQYLFKLKAYSSMIYGLIIAQLIALLSSFLGVSHMAASNGDVYVSLKTYSGNFAVINTLVWSFVIAVILTTNYYRKMEYTLVSTNLSSHLSNIALLISASIFGGLTSSLLSVVLRVVAYFVYDHSQMVYDGFFIPTSDILLEIGITILFILLVSALGYLLGLLVQISPILLITLSALLVGLSQIYTTDFVMIYDLFVDENSPIQFALKVVVTTSILYVLSIIASSRMEVKR